MSDLICEGPITKQHLECILHEYFKTSIKLVHADGNVISKGMGFTSDVMRVNLQWETNNNHLPTKVIAKAPKLENLTALMDSFTEGGEETAAIMAKMVPQIHETECRAYELLSREKPVPLPIIYGYWLVTDTSPGLIVMEDLGDRAGIIDNLATGLNMNQWLAIAEYLGDLHGWSLTTDIPWRDQVPDMSTMKDLFKTFCQSGGAMIKQSKEKYPEYFSHLKEDLIVKELDIDSLMSKMTRFETIMSPVLQHGDTWINNIMFEKKADGTLTDKIVAFIDWQICLQGSPVADLSRLEAFCVNHEMRRANSKNVLRHYYDHLKAKCGDKLTVSFEQIFDLYSEVTALNGVIGCIGVDFALHQIGRVDEDPTGERKHELLSRYKAMYDDAEDYFGWNKIPDTKT